MFQSNWRQRRQDVTRVVPTKPLNHSLKV